MNLILRIREQAKGGIADVWLIERSGCTDSGLMHGVLYLEDAEKMTASMKGVEVEREGKEADLPMQLAAIKPAHPDPTPEERVQRQHTLFEEFDDEELLQAIS